MQERSVEEGAKGGNYYLIIWKSGNFLFDVSFFFFEACKH